MVIIFIKLIIYENVLMSCMSKSFQLDITNDEITMSNHVLLEKKENL